MLIANIILFHSTGSNTIEIERVAIALGIMTLLLILMTFTSCRVFNSWLNHIGLRSYTRNRFYLAFYRYHALYWWLLGMALLSHLMLAVIHTGLPSADDADAGLQWIVLSAGIVNFSLVLTLFSSCRISLRLIERIQPDLSLNKSGFRRFFQHHSLYWGILTLVIAGHIATGYLHAGIWP